MTTTATLIAHVAGPPEKEPADTTGGWRWVQRCLRCDTEICRSVDTPSGFFRLGQAAFEAANGAFHTDGITDEDRGVDLLTCVSDPRL